MYSDSTFNGTDFIALSGMSNVLICNDEANVASKQVEFPKGYEPTSDNNLSFKVMFMNGDYGDSSSHTLNLNGLDVYVYQYGQLVLLPNHNLTISSVNGYYTLQKGTVLDLYYNPDVGGNTEGWVVIGNPVVLSSASYTIYADGKVGDITIGTVQYTYEATSPYGWLFLQGQTLSRTTYKKLWDWASDNNYVGSGKPFGAGDGSTTFTLPNLNGEFIRATGVNSHAHQGNGQGTLGEHQDATIIPNFSLNYGNGFEIFGMSHTQVDVNFPDYGYNDPSDQAWVDKTNTGAIGQTHMTSFTTRPTNTSLNIKMKVM